MCQWPYSAFGDNKPTGVLQATPSPSTNSVALQVTKPALVYNPRYPGQYFDEETGLLQNHFRSYQAAQGRYTQADPIGLGGGLNRFGYIGGNPLKFTDPLGLDATIWSPGPNRAIWDGPRNGNWGGGNWSGGIGGGKSGNAPPLDSGDACYQRHDNCYDSGVGKKSCDANLVNELKSLSDDSSKWPIAPRPGTKGDSDRFRQGAIRIFE